MLCTVTPAPIITAPLYPDGITPSPDGAGTRAASLHSRMGPTAPAAAAIANKAAPPIPPRTGVAAVAASFQRGTPLAGAPVHARSSTMGM